MDTKKLKEPLIVNYSINEPHKHDLDSSRQSLNRTFEIKDAEGNNHLYGYSFMMMFVIANSLADSSSKILFINHADLGVMEMLFLRGVIVAVMLAFLLGKEAKHILWDSVPRNMFLPIAIRCSSGMLAFYCMNTAIKHLPIILVALFQNTIPLFTSFFGFLILRERITLYEVLCLFLAFFGVYVLISSKEQDPKDEGADSNIELWPLIMCIAGPMLMSITNICLRHMKGLHEYTASTYAVICSMVTLGIAVPASGSEITVFDLFAGHEYLILIFVSIAGGVSMILKTKAF
jgi:drug/metabolite transporter (DMT)-like permease